MNFIAMCFFFTCIGTKCRMLNIKDAETNEIHWATKNATDIVLLTMNEENPFNIIAVLISGNLSEIKYDFYMGEAENFGPKFVKVDNYYGLVITKKIDYESIQEKKFYVNLDDGKTENKRFILEIQNINDNEPTFTTKPCTMKENTTINISNTVCEFQVFDMDGFLSRMTYHFAQEDRDKEELFKFQYKTIPKDTVQQTQVYLVLQEGQLLDFEMRSLYIFKLEANDTIHGTYPRKTNQIIVEVEDIADEPPMWSTIFYTQTFDEEKSQLFTVKARDGDVIINNTINYKMENPIEFIHLNAETGELTVDAIDRDKGYDLITFNITAYEKTDEKWQTIQTITFYINDIDDNSPLIISDSHLFNVSIEENTNKDICNGIFINDIDMGVNALYSVELREIDNQNEYTAAFHLVPSKGYQNGTFSIIVSNATKLDYENPLWRHISFKLISIGDNNASMTDSINVEVHLTDVNDEVPMFAKTLYRVEIKEDVQMNQFIVTVQAADRDVTDKVLKHVLIGSNINKILSIDSISGNITTKTNKAFNYEKQQEVIVQVQAEDKAQHKAIVQLIIAVLDVNDEDPVIMMEQASVKVEENQQEGTLIPTNITAADEDFDAVLAFSIDWARSYAMKNSMRLREAEFYDIKGCIHVRTEPINDDEYKQVRAILSFVDVVKNNTPNYEQYDTLFLYLEVHDNKTIHGSGTDHVMVVINVVNINDNRPVFTTDTINANRTVYEKAELKTVVGSAIIAIDEDNLNTLNYTLKSRNTTPDWIEINLKNGQLTVKNNDIDCDERLADGTQREYLYYTVSAFDGKFNTDLNISIYIRDINDKEPNLTVDIKPIKENTENNTVIYQFEAIDQDRDAPNNAVMYSFTEETPEKITNRFKIDDNQLIVFYSNNNQKFDTYYDPNYTCKIIYKDNPINTDNIQHSKYITFQIVIIDVNDKIPKVVTKNVTISENLKQGTIQSAIIQGEDRDQLGNENSKIFFNITSIKRYDDENKQIDVPQNLFNLKMNFKKQSAQLIANNDLKGYYGNFELKISTQDYGNPSLRKDDNLVEMRIQKFNYHEPKITYPLENGLYYLNTAQYIKHQLYLYNNEKFPNVTATDQENDEKFNIRLKTKFDSSLNNIFIINSADSFGRSTGQLQLNTEKYDINKTYTFKIVATIINEDSAFSRTDEIDYISDITISIAFFDISSDPIFDYTSTKGYFWENKEGLQENVNIMSANYPVKGLNIPVHYLLKEGNGSIFSVDETTGRVTLLMPLDYELQHFYKIVIQASRDHKVHDTSNTRSQIEMDIFVKDQNDNVPTFTKHTFYEVIMASYPRNMKLFTATAIDKDVNDKLTFNIKNGSMKIYVDDYIDNYVPFSVNKVNGEVSLNFQIGPKMKGYFTFEIQVVDLDPTHTSSANVKIFIIIESNKVTFKFLNSLQKVQHEKDKIVEILYEKFKYTVYIDQIIKDHIGANDLNNQTNVIVFFINEKSNIPVQQDEIITKVMDIDFYTVLAQNFSDFGLVLMSFELPNQDTTGQNQEEMLRAWLIGVTVVLGTMCFTLLTALIFKTRTLNQTIKNLSTTKFGSQESNLNRQCILAAPTTNKHALEGSNPIYHIDFATKEIDCASTQSGDSDLIGIEDNPEFDNQ